MAEERIMDGGKDVKVLENGVRPPIVGVVVGRMSQHTQKRSETCSA
jgi:hypothetical protein